MSSLDSGIARLAILLAAALGVAQPAAAQAGGEPLVMIPLHDESGTLRAYMSYQRNPDGDTIINFLDAASRSQLNAVSSNPLGDFPPFAPLPEPEPVTGCGTGGTGGSGAGPGTGAVADPGRLRVRRDIGATTGVGRRPPADQGGAPAIGIMCNAGADAAHLQAQINELRARLQEVRNRLNAAASPR